ncbi:hypothetical protein EBZ80_09295 [bacterium]|nr:hypothetical protein [bacterium]
MVIAECAEKITAKDVARIHELKVLASKAHDAACEVSSAFYELQNTDLAKVEKILEKGARLCANPSSKIKRLGAEIHVLRAQIEQKRYERLLKEIEEKMVKVQQAMQELRMRSVMAGTLDSCPE